MYPFILQHSTSELQKHKLLLFQVSPLTKQQSKSLLHGHMLLFSHVSPGQHEIFGSQHKGLSGYLSLSQQNSFESHLHLGFYGYLSPFNQQQSIAESQSQKSGLLNQVSPGQHRSLLHFKLEHLSSSGQQYMFESH